VALFRSRAGTREERRSAIVALARILEDRRDLLKEHLTRKDEAALFDIANNYDLRHRNDRQVADYDDDFLEWIFYWYLATVTLTEKLLASRT
jgi:small-conductance mechanosensitive channel